MKRRLIIGLAFAGLLPMSANAQQTDALAGCLRGCSYYEVDCPAEREQQIRQSDALFLRTGDESVLLCTDPPFCPEVFQICTDGWNQCRSECRAMHGS